MLQVRRGSRFHPAVGVSYSTLHAGCKDLIKEAGLDGTVFSTHSSKIGASTATVASGVTDSELTVLGRWRSANTGRGYVQDGPEFRARLSKRFSV